MGDDFAYELTASDNFELMDKIINYINHPNNTMFKDYIAIYSTPE